jgi:hypothetical protein
MLTHHEEAANDERWPAPDRDPVVAARLQEAGVRLATGSLDRPRYVAKRRPAWLAFFLRTLDHVDANVRRLLRKPQRSADEIDDMGPFPWADGDLLEPHEAPEGWSLREIDPAMDAWMRSMGIRPGRYSLDHPRQVMHQRPGRLASFLNRLKARS